MCSRRYHSPGLCQTKPHPHVPLRRTAAGRRWLPQEGRTPRREGRPRRRWSAEGRRQRPGRAGRHRPGWRLWGTGGQRQVPAGEGADRTLPRVITLLRRKNSRPKKPWWPDRSWTPPSSTWQTTSRRTTTGRSRGTPPWRSTSSPPNRASRGKGGHSYTDKLARNECAFITTVLNGKKY